MMMMDLSRSFVLLLRLVRVSLRSDEWHGERRQSISITYIDVYRPSASRSFVRYQFSQHDDTVAIFLAKEPPPPDAV